VKKEMTVMNREAMRVIVLASQSIRMEQKKKMMTRETIRLAEMKSGKIRLRLVLE